AGSLLDRDAANGDLDLNADITVKGAGAGKTVIDGGGIDRVFETGLAVDAALADLTVTGGDSTAGNSQEIDLGGGVLNRSDITLDRVALVANKADGGGGLFSIPATNPTIRDSLIADNTAFEGGGLRIDSGATIVNTTITGNALRTPRSEDLATKPVGIVTLLIDEISGYGGGIDHRGGALLKIVSSTITGNRALKGGGGIGAGQGYVPLSDALPLGHVELRDTIVAGNASTAGPQDCRTNEVEFVSLGHNLATDASCFLDAAGDRPQTDPRLGPLVDNGGPTRTRALLAGSPAVDAGSTQCPKGDQRGIARPQGAACDIGAFERAPVTTCRVALPARYRKQARSFDVLSGRKVLARKRKPAARVTVPAARVTLKVRLRSGRTIRLKVRATCRTT
ncbi:MAG TPA: right-handed parallel beta-helix repeat-containing protein, partial [Solirubrobacteraceae bacterium]